MFRLLLLLVLPSALCLSLRPLSLPVMTGGASLAKAGERIVSITERPPLECYGGALSAFGASLRNAGDSLAQSGATCKNKFGMEIAGDEAREAAVCLEEAAVKIRAWIESENDTNIMVSTSICDGLSEASNCAEMMGRIMYSQVTSKGGKEIEAKDTAGIVKYLLLLSESVQTVVAALEESELSKVTDGKEMVSFLREASEKFGEAGAVMRDGEVKTGGGNWLKG
ncbi:hypothetical protein TrVE_jg5023 [Triparma verrucosa]|uniref:Pectinesterase inhibitor domain-containing protein n=2 Tax=Triparma TaxID=722752 RepID=A0A9W7BU34_9STRA|nr:hypothetical protein TrVE_jg5023 [Triparma verrucosa]GMH96582.1 hypothetical protein TrST_g9357 [Triparma strigata]